jgi:hypothetical protein
MRRMMGAVLACAVLVLMAGCSEEARISGEFGTATVNGRVVLSGEFAGTSPQGIEVSVAGTGKRLTLDAMGEFAFMDIPTGATLRFSREDGLDHEFVLGSSNREEVVVEINARGRGSRNRPVRGRLTQLEGIVEEVSGTSLTLLDSHRGSVTVTINEETVIRKGQTALEATDLEPGDRVHVMASGPNEAMLAVQIMLQNTGDDDDDDVPAMGTANGLVAAVGASQLSVTTGSGREMIVMVTPDTEIRSRGRALAFSEIEVGDRVEAMGRRIDATTIEARKINVQQ